VTAERIDGKAAALALRQRVAKAVAHLNDAHGLQPGLAVVLVGEDPASEIYVRNKGRQTRDAGMVSRELRFDVSIPEDTLLATVGELNADPAVHGILVQLPLPDHIDEQRILKAIDPRKDVDGFHPVNAGGVATGDPDALVPCTPMGCLLLLREQFPDGLAGQRALVIGRSNIVGKPMAHLLLAESCTVTIAHSRTRDLPSLCREADIVVAAVGRPELVEGAWLKPGAVVIDVGINRREQADGEKPSLVGDVNFLEAMAVAGAVTPVPGGVGPMTIACLLRNTLIASARQHNLVLGEAV